MTTHNTDTDIITIEVTLEVANWENPRYTLTVNGDNRIFNRRASHRLTNTHGDFLNGIFTTKGDADWGKTFSNGTIVKFLRGDTEVEVDFGDFWEPSAYENPALEIKRRVQAVNAAFDAVKETYTKVWTVDL